MTPPADGSRALALSWLSEEFGVRARGVGLRLVQAVGLWLPTGPDDYAIPGLAVVESDFREAHVMKNCYAPHVFRMVLEVTSTNWADDLGPKVEDYAQAGIPVYVVAEPQARPGAGLHRSARRGVPEPDTPQAGDVVRRA
ncbi:Uma2 family endonuclease [Streptomyces sp. NPDC058637]|uniref:Uma2 family endonuclease n=1 Tax=Streptomyces sp. NPDC058637 TaxID=3346569 RepID=UPI00365727C2